MLRAFRLASRHVTLALGVLALAHPARAQAPAGAPAPDRHLLDQEVRSAGWWAVDTRLTRFTGAQAVVTGLRGGWTLNRRFTVGAAALGNVTTRIRTGRALPSGRGAGLEFNYGGLELGYVHRPSRLLHAHLTTIVGGGGTSYADARGGDTDLPVDGFFVVEPALHTVINVSRRFRIATGTSYRVTRGARLTGLDDGDVSGLSTSITFRFGGY